MKLVVLLVTIYNKQVLVYKVLYFFFQIFANFQRYVARAVVLLFSGILNQNSRNAESSPTVDVKATAIDLTIKKLVKFSAKNGLRLTHTTLEVNIILLYSTENIMHYLTSKKVLFLLLFGNN